MGGPHGTELPAGARTTCIPHHFPPPVDLLFVVDDGPGSGAAQAAVAKRAAAFVDSLESHVGPLAVRVGVTTTTADHPLCDGLPNGELLLRSCREHLGDFEDPSACTDACPLESLSVTPSATEKDEETRVRPWLERTEYGDNLGGMALADAVACAIPQGDAGCRFASPVDAALKALRRTDHPDDEGHGFLHRNGVLVVVFLTTRFDCSQGADADWLLSDEGRALWPDPEAAEPTPAVFWSLGVACEGGPGTYENCVPRTPEPGEPELVAPLDPLIQALQELEDDRKARSPRQEVFVAIVGGVPKDPEVAPFQDGSPEEQAAFGIGPGCFGRWGPAYPPVRLLEVASRFEVDGQALVGSICAPEASSVFEDLRRGIEETLPGGCFLGCAADVEPSVPGLQTQCTMSHDVPRAGFFERRDLDECEGTTGAPRVPEGEEVCFVRRVGVDLHPSCAEQGLNLSIQIVRNAPPRPGEAFHPRCERSEQRDVDCPNL